MPKTDLVPCYYAGSDRTGEPDFCETRDKLWGYRDEGAGNFVDHGTVFQMSRPKEQERGASSKTAVVAFSKVQNKMQHPSRINYPVPACGDHRLRWLMRFMITRRTAELV